MLIDELSALIPELFAPWVQSMNLSILAVNNTGASFALPAASALVRGGGKGGGVICGQALAAAADTVSVLALSHLNNRFRACTTTDLNVRFMRALSSEADVYIEVESLSNGRRMAVTEIRFHSMDKTGKHSEKVAALASAGFMYLED